MLVCLSALGQGAPLSSYKKTITTTGSPCQLEGYTHKKGPAMIKECTHPCACLCTHPSAFMHAGYLSYLCTPTDACRRPPCPLQVSNPVPHSSAMTWHFITRQHEISPPTRGRGVLCQSFDTALAEEVNPHPAGQGSTAPDLTTCLPRLSVSAPSHAACVWEVC